MIIALLLLIFTIDTVSSILIQKSVGLVLKSDPLVVQKRWHYIHITYYILHTWTETETRAPLQINLISLFSIFNIS
jgi:hypothetical protein